MSVATHLGIDLAEYDARIRTFIPHYEEMLDIAASAIDPKSHVIVDLGIGTGALSARCLQTAPEARIIGIDADAVILKAAALPSSAIFHCSSFLRVEIPACDAVVASFALHHVRTRRSKATLYARIARALKPGGRVVTVDCQPASNVTVARRQRDAWKVHLMQAYSEEEAANYLEAWSHEDVYVPLDSEVELMHRAGLTVEVLWRKDAFAVMQGRN